MEAKAMITKIHPILFAFLVYVSGFAATARTAADEYQQALKALAANNYKEALSHFESAVVAEPDNAVYSNEYRKAIIQSKEFDRALDFFEKRVREHPDSANLHLNYGFAYVDKIPVAGAITQVILADRALTQFTKSVELRPDWIGYYTRGQSYLFWPKIFNRAPLGVADLEKAMEMQKKEPNRGYHVRLYVALGDGYWKTDQLEKAIATWRAGLQEFPDNANLKRRLAASGDDLKTLIESGFDPAKRVNTDLSDLWTN